MGQAQRSRQQDVRYRDVELDLWELDADERNYGDRNSRRGRAGADRSVHRGNGTGRRPASANSRNRVSQADDGSRRRRTDSREYAEGRGYRRDGRNPSARGRSDAGGPNIMLYEQRQGRAGNSRTRTRRPERELQIQDIRRYQGGKAERRRGTAAGHARDMRSVKRRRARVLKVYFARMSAALLTVMCLVVIYYMVGEIYKMVHDIRERNDNMEKGIVQTVSEEPSESAGGIAPPDIIEDYLEINEFSRPGTKLGKINSIFVHYTANPGTSAAQNRSYFANLALTQERSASAHLIIGYDGEIIQCIPFDEQAYAVMTRNEDSISIECCFLSDDGSFTQETYDTLVHTLAWLTERFDLSTSDILRHYDCGGKKCPVYYVENEGEWERLLRDVEDYKSASETAQKAPY